MTDGMEYLIGIDLGSGGVKGVALTTDGVMAATAGAEVEFADTTPPLVEIDPERHYRQLRGVIRKLADECDGRVAAVAMAAASGNTLLLDDENKPLTNIISWLDRRPAVGGFDPSELRSITGWPCVDRFPIAHLAWWRGHEPELLRRAGRIVMNNDYLYFRLTGRFGLDYSTASSFHLFNQPERRWHQPYLDKFEINPSQLSPLAPSGSVLGKLTAAAAADCDLSTDTLAVLGSFDHPSAARGCGILEPGRVLLSCGTSWVAFTPVESRAEALALNMLIDPFLSQSGGGPWAGMLSVSGIGGKMDEWLRELPGISDYDMFIELAAACKSPLTPELAEELTERPPSKAVLDEYPLETVCRALADEPVRRINLLLRRLIENGVPVSELSMVGGAARHAYWRNAIGEQTGLPLKSPFHGRNAGAVGAAVLAGIGAGHFKNEKEAVDKMSAALVNA